MSRRARRALGIVATGIAAVFGSSLLTGQATLYLGASFALSVAVLAVTSLLALKMLLKHGRQVGKSPTVGRLIAWEPDPNQGQLFRFPPAMRDEIDRDLGA
jgi:cobalamin biosynthesis protein CobD/CbiB